jgi:hypothetical protein
MLILFALSGMWQELPRHYWDNNRLLLLISTIHQGHGFKTMSGHFNLSSPFLVGFILLMAASLILNIILGIIMAFRFGRRPFVLGSLAAGASIPLLLILIFAQS